MFAVIKTGGKQYRVQKGDILEVEKLHQKDGDKVSFDQVLLIESDGKTSLGTPFVDNAVVKASVLENFKDKKVIVFKKKRRKQYKKTRGHRQELTRVQIDEILTGTKSAAKKPAVKTEAAKTTKKPAAKAVPAKKAAVKAEPAKTAKKPAAKAAPAKKAAEKKPKAAPAAKKTAASKAPAKKAAVKTAASKKSATKAPVKKAEPKG